MSDCLPTESASPTPQLFPEPCAALSLHSSPSGSPSGWSLPVGVATGAGWRCMRRRRRSRRRTARIRPWRRHCSACVG
eukprot:5086298-Prymnesium_polylepis.1